MSKVHATGGIASRKPTKTEEARHIGNVLQLQGATLKLKPSATYYIANPFRPPSDQTVSIDYTVNASKNAPVTFAVKKARLFEVGKTRPLITETLVRASMTEPAGSKRLSSMDIGLATGTNGNVVLERGKRYFAVLDAFFNGKKIVIQTEPFQLSGRRFGF